MSKTIMATPIGYVGTGQPIYNLFNRQREILYCYKIYTILDIGYTVYMLFMYVFSTQFQFFAY